MEQRSEEWYAARLGKVTASRINDVMASGRGGATSLTRQRYQTDLLAERLTGEITPMPTTAAMEWGTKTEPMARYAYEFLMDEAVTEAPFVPHPSIPDTGASPDGLVGETGLIEIKCPNTATHLRHLETGKIERRYMLQMHWQMCCAQKLWCDFVSFDPRAPDGLKISTTRVARDDELVVEMEAKVKKFIAELTARETALRNSNKSRQSLPDMGDIVKLERTE